MATSIAIFMRTDYRTIPKTDSINHKTKAVPPLWKHGLTNFTPIAIRKPWLQFLCETPAWQRRLRSHD